VGIEIERKFLVSDRSVVVGLAGTEMRQGYLSVDPERTTRVRIAGRRAFVTIKGVPSDSGASRAEYEYEIPVGDAAEMLDRLALRPLVEKTRYRLPVGRLTWEIDVFEGDNEGLVVAEIELPTEAMGVVLPDWIGDEVTGDPRYYNASLVGHPYREWDKA
jgi:CYTH domain-containing protein